MKFIFKKDAPDIPERMLRLHEDGNLIFFCGAGISLPAGLPVFKNLIKDIYEELGEDLNNNPQEKIAFKSERYDLVISLLEQRIGGGRNRVRQQLAKIICNPVISEKNLSVHNSIVDLSLNKENKLRLVTTNFDLLFEHILSKENPRKRHFVGPFVPIVNSQWDGIVYLHGLISEEPELGENGPVIVSSGDFGQAYLVDRWASKFICDLFKKYSICFVGYSVEDPIVRYITDALTASKLIGENHPEMFSFCSFEPKNKEEKINMWKSKGITPIPYNQGYKHILLRETLREWSNEYKEGFLGKVQLIERWENPKPSKSTLEGDDVGRLIWAIGDPSGKPAQAFARRTPVFDLSWIFEFDRKGYFSKDLPIFNPDSLNKSGIENKHTLLRRPNFDDPSSPSIYLATHSLGRTGYDGVMNAICNWLLRFLNNPNLIIWISEKGGSLHPCFRALIINRLQEIYELEKENNTLELEKITNESPEGLPNDFMKILWGLAVAGKLEESTLGFLLLSNYKYFQNHRELPVFKRLFIKAISPYAKIRESYKCYRKECYTNSEPRKENFEIVLEVSDMAISFYKRVRSSSCWQENLPTMAMDLTLLLKETMDILKALGKVTYDRDYSFVYVPKISDIDEEISYSASWTFIVRLLRDSWLALNNKNADQAELLIDAWWDNPYPVFKKLSLFAFLHVKELDFTKIFTKLTEANSKWLWSSETQNEVLQLLIRISKESSKVSMKNINQLEKVLISGIPNEFFKDNILLREKKEYSEKAILRRLAKIDQANRNSLSDLGGGKLNELKKKYNYSSDIDESEEPPVRIVISSGYRDYPEIFLPEDEELLFNKIRIDQNRKEYETDNWGILCEKSIELVVKVLLSLKENEFNSYEWWDSAFQNWVNEETLTKSWELIADKIILFSDNFFQNCHYGISRWLKRVAEIGIHNKKVFFSLIEKVVFTPGYENDFMADYVQSAINHPIGISTMALINWLYNTSPNDNSMLDQEFRAILTKICREKRNEFLYGKVIVATYLVLLFRVDPDWTVEYFLPFFDWDIDKKIAAAVWQGYLRGTKSHFELLEKIKNPFLATANHMDKLGEIASSSFIRLIAYLGIYKPKFLTYKEIRKIMDTFNVEQLSIVSRYLKNQVKNVGENIEIFWTERFSKFFQYVWPKNKELVNPTISEDLALMCIESKNMFEVLYNAIQFYFSPIEYPMYVLMQLNENKLCESAPESSLSLLGKTIDKKSKIIDKSHLEECLASIIERNPKLKANPTYQRLYIIV